jgi:hypothetical protein
MELWGRISISAAEVESDGASRQSDFGGKDRLKETQEVAHR